MKVVVLQGLPASGKSSWAIQFVNDNPGWKRVNKDLLREMLDGGKWSANSEKFILSVRDRLILSALDEGFSVIVDDTNLHPKHLKRIRDIVPVGIEVEEKFFDVPVMECIYRDAARPKPVGKKIIFETYERYIKTRLVYSDDDPREEAVIFDMDGTLALATNRGPFEFRKVLSDRPNMPIVDLANLLSEKFPILVVSGRDDSCVGDTVQWLENNGIPYRAIYMRVAGDNRQDAIVKREIYERDIKPRYRIKYVVDDRDQVVAMWRGLGLQVLQSDYGPF